MTARTFAEDRPDERYPGRALPWHVCARLAVPFLGPTLGVYVVFGTLSALLVALSFGGCLLALSVYLGSRLRNNLVLHTDHVTISVWTVFPLGTSQVRYETISRIEADDSGGNLGIWFTNEAGEPDAAEIVLDPPYLASKARDGILQRQASQGGCEDKPEAVSVAAVSPETLLPDSRGEKSSQTVETPAWMKWGLAVGGLLGLAAAVIGDGVFSLGVFIGLGIFVLVMALLIAAMEKFQTYFFLHFDRVDMRSGLGGTKHRIRYRDVVDAQGTATGWLQVTYTKKPTLGFGGGEKTAGLRLKRHSLTPVVAEAIKLGRDRAARNAGARGWQAGEGRG